MREGKKTDYAELLHPTKLPDTLKQLHLFQDFNAVLHPEYVNRRRAGKRSTNRDFRIALASASRPLESLSASFVVDAEDFFHGPWPMVPDESPARFAEEGSWQHLKTLALTSRLLGPDRSPATIRKLLLAAGYTALFMPKLDVMELWNAGKQQQGGQGHACYFRFNRNRDGDGTPGISLQSTWDASQSLSRVVVGAWEKVARVHSGRDLTVSVGQWDPADHFESYSDLLQHLVLRRQILDPVPLYQEQWEAAHHSIG